MAAVAAVKAMKGVSTPQRSTQDAGPPPPYKLADFRTVQELGGGSFGVVQQVVHHETGEVFAMKVLEKRKVVEKELQEQLKCEVVTQLRAKHPNVVRMHYYFEDAMRVYCLLEYADQGQLFAYLKKHGETHGGGVPEPRAAAFLSDTAKGLEYLHGLGVVHRDLKPENILLYTQALVAKLGDLGWCAEITSERPARHTFCGTMDYLSPEMLMNEPHDISVDIWALGVLLFEMLLARAPFVGASQKESVDRICAVQVEVPPGSMTAGPAEIIQGLLQREKEARMPISKVLQHPWVVSLGHAQSMGLQASDASLGAQASNDAQKSSGSSATAAGKPGGHNWRSGGNLEERPTRHVPRQEAGAGGGGPVDTRPLMRQTARAVTAVEESLATRQHGVQSEIHYTAPPDAAVQQGHGEEAEALNTDLLGNTNADLYARIRDQMDQLNESFRERVRQQNDRRQEKLEQLHAFDPGPRTVLSPKLASQEALDTQASPGSGSVHVSSEASDAERHEVVATAERNDSTDEDYCVTPPRARDNELLSVVQDSCISLEELDSNPSFMLDGQWNKLPDASARQKPRATSAKKEFPRSAPEARFEGGREVAGSAHASMAGAADEHGWADSEADSRRQRQRMRAAEQSWADSEADSRRQRQRPREAANAPFTVGGYLGPGLDPTYPENTRFSNQEAVETAYISKEAWRSPAASAEPQLVEANGSSLVEAGGAVWEALFGGAATTAGGKWKEQGISSASIAKTRRCT